MGMWDRIKDENYELRQKAREELKYEIEKEKIDKIKEQEKQRMKDELEYDLMTTKERIMHKLRKISFNVPDVEKNAKDIMEKKK